jgi:ubiquinone/menaquinone biosynthesis C-methylase UbiE
MSHDTTPRDFSAQAANWDEKPARLKLAGEIAQVMTREMGLTREMDVLDFGCGTGLLSLHLQPLARTVTGADTAEGMLAVLAAKIEGAGIANMKLFHIGPDGNLPEGPFDRVVSAMTLHHVPDPALALSRFYAATAPGGLVCVADLDQDQGEFHEDNQGVYHFGFDREAVAAMFARAGFSGVRHLGAAHVTRPDKSGVMRDFGVFVCLGEKPR